MCDCSKLYDIVVKSLNVILEKKKEKVCGTALFMPFNTIYHSIRFLEMFFKMNFDMGTNDEGQVQITSQPGSSLLL